MLNGRKAVLYKLNEVPLRILDRLASARPHSAFSTLLRDGKTYQTVTEDAGHLRPWITWPTLHRGVTTQQHEIYGFGQELKEIDREFPPIWSFLPASGCKVGLFGSLHGYPVPSKFHDYPFYVPDTFAAGSAVLVSAVTADTWLFHTAFPL